MKRVAGAAWVLLVLLAACHDPNAYTVTPDNVDSVVRVDVTSATIPADGLSRTTITATVTPGAASDRREVTFTASRGTLLAGSQQASQVKVTADAAGQAVVQLRSDSIVGTVRVDIQVLTVVRSVTVDFTAPVADDTFTLSAAPAAIPADGFSESTISVRLKNLGTTAQRTVEFRTTAGLLDAPGVAASDVITVPANADGLAVAQLQSSKVVGTARVTTTALNVSRTVEVPFTGVAVSDIITLAAGASSLPADGKSTARITATIAQGLPATRRTVTFRLTGTGGMFLPELKTEVTREADASGQARVDLQTDSKTGFARVSAEVDKTTSNDVSIQMVPALPDRIFLRSDAVRLKSGDEIAITAELRRTIGTVTIGTVATFSAVTDKGAVIGAFRNVRTSNTDGDATATFSLGTTSYSGPVTITAAVAGGPSVSITVIVD
jgi:hypothetical protein